MFFVLPWLGKTLLGTTDTDCDETPDALTVTDDDVAYLLEGHNHYCQPSLAPGDLLGRFAGVRPLLRASDDNPSSVLREYRLAWSPSGMLTVAGGKYTTYRHMAEVVTDAVVQRLGCAAVAARASCPLTGRRTSPGLNSVPARLPNSRPTAGARHGCVPRAMLRPGACDGRGS